ncbi:hypothetical protein [uncultured Nitratireductor sp.]|uniref:hypothetical protein n=1 Tax=uncultured Nitratireductor sp. TaxID=520953 RepID=UPI0025FEDA94|nr:hypothetical protein [uncultured Nitratireductor sp.]
MSKKAHTPGPWVIIPAEEYCGDDPDLDGAFMRPASIEGSDGNPVCTFGSEDGSGTLFENEADYALIAAAPDMLEALMAWKKYDILLRSLPLQGPLYGGEMVEVDKAYDACVVATDAALSKATGGAS